MPTRPWPIRILALLFIIAPLANAFLLASAWDVSLRAYLRVLFQEPWWVVLEALLPLPAAGLAIFAMKRWSYVAFLSLTAFVFLRNGQNYRLMPDLMSAPFLVLAYAINLFVVAYFLMPAVRVAYFNSRLRWWEALPRIRVEIPLRLVHGDSVRDVLTLDFSAGGALVRSPVDLADFFPGDRATAGSTEARVDLRSEFSYEDDPQFVFSLPVRVVHRRMREDEFVYGLQFSHVRSRERRRLRRLIRRLEGVGAQRIRTPPPLWTDFREWLSTGGTLRAWVPAAPRPPDGSKRGGNSDRT